MDEKEQKKELLKDFRQQSRSGKKLCSNTLVTERIDSTFLETRQSHELTKPSNDPESLKLQESFQLFKVRL
jgi:hypothetical protein